MVPVTQRHEAFNASQSAFLDDQIASTACLITAVVVLLKTHYSPKVIKVRDNIPERGRGS